MTMESKIICEQCDNDAFYEYKGFLVCRRCQVLVEGFIEDVVDCGDRNYRPLPKIKSPPPPPPPPQDPEEPISYYEETRDRYVKGFVMMITYQCDALVEKFNVTPLIIGLVGPICLRFVSLSGVFDNRDSELRGEERTDLNGKGAIKTWVTLLKKSLPLSASLAISFLACHKAGATVLPTDIVRWAREAKIPYPSCYLKIQEQMGASKMFSPFMVVSAQRLDAQAASIADITGLPLPSVDLHGTASNYLKRLSIIPDEYDKKILLDLVRLIQNWSIDKLGVPLAIARKRARSSGRASRKMKKLKWSIDKRKRKQVG